MDDEPPAPEDERAEELSAISAIFPELKQSPSSPFSASLELAVVPISPLKVLFEQLVTESKPHTLLPTPPDSTEADVQNDGAEGLARQPTNTEPDIHPLSNLPPLLLEIDLPEGYPSEKPPVFHITTNPLWLGDVHVKRLEEYGTKLWEEQGKYPVVYDYIDYLRQSAENVFDILGHEEETLKFSRDMKIALLDFDIRAKREAFERSTFECGVCLEVKKGSACYRLLLCSHVFCVACLQDFYNSCISEGDVDNVKCLAPDCGKESKIRTVDAMKAPEQGRRKRKENRTLNPSELLQIPLEQDVVQRYVMLKRKKKLESDKTTVYCPRQWCQGAARSKKYPKVTDPIEDAENESDINEDGVELQITYDPTSHEGELPPMADRLAVCEDCSYAFCVVCKKGWHGELASCFPRKQAELNAEEEATAKYIALHTATCPTCSAPCQKMMGCNHMICFKCRTHFCYLCSSWLSEQNPYAHFNNMKSPCYLRLWELEGGDGGEGEVGLGFGGGPLGGDQDHDVLNPWDDDSDSDSTDGGPNDNGDWSDEEWEEGQQRVRQPPPPAPNPPRAPARAAAPQNPFQGMQGNQGLGRGRGAPPPQQELPGRPRQQGLQRFIAMAQNDDEDDWDSDEAGSDFEI